MVEVRLFPGIVTDVAGIVSPLPAVLEPIQNVVVPRVALVKVKVLLPGAPVELFHVTWTFETEMAL